jgi:hypothetical protein
VTLVNALLVRLADGCSPLARLPPVAVVAGCALGSALAVLAVMRLRRIRRRSSQHIHALRDAAPNGLPAAACPGRGAPQPLVGLSLVPLVITVPLTSPSRSSGVVRLHGCHAGHGSRRHHRGRRRHQVDRRFSKAPGSTWRAATHRSGK